MTVAPAHTDKTALEPSRHQRRRLRQVEHWHRRLRHELRYFGADEADVQVVDDLVQRLRQQALQLR